MKQRYKLSGMTCNGCKADVISRIAEVSGIQQVRVDLEKAEMELQMAENVPISALRQVLPSKYEVHLATTTTDVMESLAPVQVEQSTWQQLYPLFLILAYITIAALLLNRTDGGVAGFMFDFMGLFYIVFSFFKFLGFKEFPDSFQRYDPLAKIVPFYGWLYPFMETVLGVLFLMRMQLNSALVATILVLGITTVGVAKTLMDKKSIPCACLGTVLKLPMTKATLIENSIMLVMAIWMLLDKV